MAQDDDKRALTGGEEGDKEHIELEPADAQEEYAPAAAEERKREMEPLPLEDVPEVEVEGEASRTEARQWADEGERCPHCGAPMPADALVCLRCGYDLKELEVRRTRIEKPAVVDTEIERQAAVSEPGRGDYWLPLAMAAVSGLVLIIGYLAGAAGLYPDFIGSQGAEAVISLRTRIFAVLQFLVLVGIFGVCGLAGLFLVAQALQRPVGEMSLAAARMLGIVASIRLVTFLAMPGPRWVEWLSEAVLQAAAFVCLSILLYSLKPRDGGVMGIFALGSFVGLWICAKAMVWALEG